MQIKWPSNLSYHHSTVRQMLKLLVSRDQTANISSADLFRLPKSSL